jgi:hypothetical protein
MCKLCDEGKPQDHSGSRRDFLKAATATGAAAGLNLFAARPAAARDDDDDRRGPPEDHGRPRRRYIIRGGAVMSMDPKVGDFPQADVLVEGKKILAVGPNLQAGGAGEIDARGRIVMPGFIDTHHHQFETALRSFLADGSATTGRTRRAAPPTTEHSQDSTGVSAQDVTSTNVRRQASSMQRRHYDISQIHHSSTPTPGAIPGAALPWLPSGVSTKTMRRDAVRSRKWFSSA